MTVPPGFLAAVAQRAQRVHLLPADGAGKITSKTARCGWRPRPTRCRPIRWNHATHHNPADRCPRCFTTTEPT